MYKCITVQKHTQRKFPWKVCTHRLVRNGFCMKRRLLLLLRTWVVIIIVFETKRNESIWSVLCYALKKKKEKEYQVYWLVSTKGILNLK